MEERISRPETTGSGNRVVGFFVGLAERYLPDAFLFAVVLTLALSFTVYGAFALIAPFFL